MIWYTFTVLGLGARGVGAVALVLIAFQLCAFNKESKLFTECVEDVKSTGKSISASVSFCNGGSF